MLIGDIFFKDISEQNLFQLRHQTFYISQLIFIKKLYKLII